MNPNEIPSQAEFGLLRSYLAKRKFSQSQIKEAVGDNPNGKTRHEITNQIINWLKNKK